MKRPRFEIHSARYIDDSKGPGWYWILRARNGEIVATSETYSRRADAFRGAQAAKRNAWAASIGAGDKP